MFLELDLLCLSQQLISVQDMHACWQMSCYSSEGATDVSQSQLRCAAERYFKDIWCSTVRAPFQFVVLHISCNVSDH